MNYTSKSGVGASHARKDTRQAVSQEKIAYNSASEALDAYIAAFEKRANLYSRRPSDLLAPKPKFYFMDSLERSLLGSPGKSPGQKVDDLVAWVNQTYNQNLTSIVEPFGGTADKIQGSRKSIEARDVGTRTAHQSYYPPMRSAEMDELSSLPSASSSLVDLDSNVGTVETDVLLSSFKGDKPEDKYSRSNIYSPANTRSPVPHKTSSTSPQRSSGNFEYPSWVSHLGKEYPSWVEDLDNTVLSKRSSRSPQPRFMSTGKSSLDSNLNKLDREPMRSMEELKLSDLKLRSSPKSRTSKSHHSRSKESRKDWTDTASMDTDILVSQSIYGNRPVNMGGALHKTLYEDPRVNRIKKESTRKLRKSSEKSRSRARERTHERTQVSPNSKSVTYSTPDHATRPLSPRGYHSVPPKSRAELESNASPTRYKDYSPLRSGDHRHSPERLELRPTQFTMPVRSPNFQSTEIRTREDPISSRSQDRYSSQSSMQISSKSHSPEMSPSHARKPLSSSHVKRPVTQSSKSRELKEKGESSDTDREMRKSPTGIRMEKIYREPTAMYPWKTMIQSRNHKSVAFSDDYDYTPEKPVYESTPAVRSQSIDKRKQVPNQVPSRDLYDRVTGPTEYVTERVTHYFPKKSPGLRSAPPSTERTLAIEHKPPIAPRSSLKQGGHRRSRTMPDLRKLGSESRHAKTRRSYDDDMLSIVTSDTEALVTQPSMPIVDVSPSLTTVSDSSDTIIGSDTESEREPRHGKALGITQVSQTLLGQEETTFDSSMQRSGEEKFSPTSVFASSSPYAAVREELPKRYHLWKLDEDTTAPDSFIRKKHVPGGKSNIISSFLEDCLKIDDDDIDHNSNKVRSSSFHSPSRLSGKEGAPGPVEALKNMLFTMQDMAHHDDETPRISDTKRQYTNRVPADDNDSFNDNQSDTSSQLFHGEESLQRAYHHLQRLKRLVGSEDDQSSIASDL